MLKAHVFCSAGERRKDSESAALLLQPQWPTEAAVELSHDPRVHRALALGGVFAIELKPLPGKLSAA